ncbi:hypothetical protein R1flu_010336 [Riccia fluitans]|uniref:Uncharacterized protein n=1 Tax=Riccia fluitans TaxID=41844 RepID=A0ABD1Z4P9_9MARC
MVLALVGPAICPIGSRDMTTLGGLTLLTNQPSASWTRWLVMPAALQIACPSYDRREIFIAPNVEERCRTHRAGGWNINRWAIQQIEQTLVISNSVPC